jgi:hypothetical protein
MKSTKSALPSSDLGARLGCWRRCGCGRRALGQFCYVPVEDCSQRLRIVCSLKSDHAQLVELVKRHSLAVALRACHRVHFVPRGQ